MMHAGCLAVALLAATVPATAHGDGAPQPLVVVVERQRVGGASAESIRRAIADEVGRTVVGPQDPVANIAADILLVTLGPESVTMDLRRAGVSVPLRRVEAVPGGATALQVVAWLAGNLVRDQASDVLAAARVVPPAPDQTDVTLPDPTTAGEAATAAPRASGGPVSPAATEPPVQPPPPRPVAVIKQAPRTAAPRAAEEDLRLGIQAGYAMAPLDFDPATSFFPTARLEFLAHMRGQWISWFSLNVQGGWLAAGLSGGVVRRVHLVPDLWTVEIGGGAGFLVGERDYFLASPGGLRANRSIGFAPVINGAATFVLSTWVAETVVTLGVNDNLGQLSRPNIIITGGGRVAF